MKNDSSNNSISQTAPKKQPFKRKNFKKSAERRRRSSEGEPYRPCSGGEHRGIQITIEEFFQSKSEPANKKFHNLKYIEKIADNVGGRTFEKSRIGGSTNDTSAIYNIPDLFEFVKRYDPEFKPKPVSKHLLNADGTPKVLYHGTRSQFTTFELQDKPTFGRALGDGLCFLVHSLRIRI